MKIKLNLILMCGLVFSSFGYSKPTVNKENTVLEQAQQNFVNNYIEAINNNDLAKLKALAHPSLLSCINLQNRDYYEHRYQQTLKRTIPATYKVKFVELTKNESDKELKGAEKLGVPYSIAPSHQIELDYNKDEYSFVTINRYLVWEKGQYYEAGGCISDKLLVRFREIQVRKKEDKARAKLLFSKIDESLLDELTVLLKQGNKIQAWKTYSGLTGESLGTAKQVLANIDLE